MKCAYTVRHPLYICVVLRVSLCHCTKALSHVLTAVHPSFFNSQGNAVPYPFWREFPAGKIPRGGRCCVKQKVATRRRTTGLVNS